MRWHMKQRRQIQGEQLRNYAMLILFVVLLGSVQPEGQNIAPSVQYDAPKTKDIRFGEDYNLTCVVEGQNTDGATWLKDGEEINSQALDIKRDNQTLRVTYRIQKFDCTDIGNYTCTYEYEDKDKVRKQNGEILQLDYRPDESDDQTCISMKKRCYRSDYSAGEVIPIPKNRLLTEHVITIKAKVLHNNNKNWGSNIHKRAETSNEQNIGLSPKDLSFEEEKKSKKFKEMQDEEEMELELTAYTFKLLSIEQHHGSSPQKDTIDVNIRVIAHGQTQIDWNVNGTLKKTFERKLFNLHRNYLTLQLSYNSETKSFKMLTSPENVRHIALPADSLRNLEQIRIGNDFNMNDVSIEHMRISICRKIATSVSLTVELKKDAIHLICTATGSPFLTIKWTTGGRVKLAENEWRDEDGTSLTRKLTISTSDLSRYSAEVYTCHVSSTSNGGADVSKSITLRGEDYRQNVKTCDDCSSGDSNAWTKNEPLKYTDTSGYKAKTVLAMALGGISGFFLIILVTQYIIIKKDEDNKDKGKKEDAPDDIQMTEQIEVIEGCGRPHDGGDIGENIYNDVEAGEGEDNKENDGIEKTDEEDTGKMKNNNEEKDN